MNTPIEDWHSDESNRLTLAELLSHDVMRRAMALLQWDRLPRNDGIERPSADAITHAAMERTRDEGFFDYATQLAELTVLPTEPETKPEPYSDEYILETAKQSGMI